SQSGQSSRWRATALLRRSGNSPSRNAWSSSSATQAISATCALSRGILLHAPPPSLTFIRIVSRAPSSERPDMNDDQKSCGQSTSVTLRDRARRREPQAWERLVELYRPLVLFWCGRAGLHGPDAEDVSQEVLAAAAAGLDGFRRDRPGDTFRGWLRGITRNQVLLFYRRSQRQPRADGGPAALDPLREAADPLAGADDQAQAKAPPV